ncbi:MAG: DUF4097 family beta strand repeat-containing protein, partial [Acidobacteriaceae bacterium]
DAWKAQRSYWYAMRRPSILRPFVLIAIGVVALLIQTGKISGYAFWGWYVHWWPLLLIALGLLSLLEWFSSRNSAYGARSSVGGLVGVIILLAILGIVGHHAEQSPFGWHFSPDDQSWGMHFFGKAHDRDAQFDQDFPAGGVLVVDNPRGDVNIAASTDDRIHVSAHDTVYAGNDRQANRQLDQLAPHFHLTGQRGALTTRDVSRGSADLTIQLPDSASVTVHAGHGDISINGINGALNLDSGHGDIALNKIGNAVVAKMSEGDFSAHLIAGTLALSGRTNDASVTAVKGPVSLNGDFFGDVSLSQLEAPLTFHSSRTSFTVQHLPGDLSLDSGDLHVTRATAPLRLDTKAKNIVLAGLSAGPTNIQNSDGDVDLQMASPFGDVEVHNNNGGIQLTVPQGASFHLDATASQGDVSSDVKLTDGDSSDHSLRGDAGSGASKARITLVADHGDIRIQKGSPSFEPPQPPEPPAAPKAPKAPRLKAPAGAIPEPTAQ